MKRHPFVTIEESNNGRTRIEKGAFALVVTAANELQLFLPATTTRDAVFPQYALALLAVADRMRDKAWVEELLIDEFAPDKH